MVGAFDFIVKVLLYLYFTGKTCLSCICRTVRSYVIDATNRQRPLADCCTKIAMQIVDKDHCRFVALINCVALFLIKVHLKKCVCLLHSINGRVLVADRQTNR